MESPYLNTLPTTHQKAFIFDRSVPCSVNIDSSTTSDMMVHAPGGARGQNLGHTSRGITCQKGTFFLNRC